MTMGQKIKQARENKNLSQEELAEKLGVTRQAVSKWENDSSVPQGINREMISQVLGVELQTSETEPKKSEPKRKWPDRLGWGVAFVLLLLLNVAVWRPFSRKQENTMPEEDTVAAEQEIPRLLSITFYDKEQQEVESEALWYDVSKIESILIQWKGGSPSNIKMFLTPSGSETAEMTELLLTQTVLDGDVAALLSADSLKGFFQALVYFELDFGAAGVLTSEEYNMAKLSVEEEGMEALPDESEVPAARPVSIASAVQNYVKDYGTDHYENDYVTLDRTEHLSYCVSGNGVTMFYDGIFCGYFWVTQWEVPFSADWQEHPEYSMVGSFSNMKASHRLLETWQESETEIYAYRSETQVYTMGDEEWITEKDILTPEELQEQCAVSYSVLLGQNGSKCGYYLELSAALADEETLRQVIRAITFYGNAFEENALSQFQEEPELPKLPENEYSFFEPRGEECCLEYEPGVGEVVYTIPKGFRGVQSGEQDWLIYDNYGTGTEVGYVRAEQVEAGTELAKIIEVYGAAFPIENSMETKEENGLCSYTCKYMDAETGGYRRRTLLTDRKEIVLVIDSVCYNDK